MKTAILGAGAMGSVIGGTLARAGHDVILLDVAKEIVDAIEIIAATDAGPAGIFSDPAPGRREGRG